MEWWFEDYTVGRAVVSPGRTVTEADLVAFAGLTGDYHPLHTDAIYAAGSEFGGRIAHGLLGLGLAAGLLARRGLIEPAVLALLGVGDWRFVAPIYPGDTIRARAVVEAARPSGSKPDRGVVTLAVEVLRQDDSVAQRGALTLMVARRPTTAGPTATRSG